MARRPTPATIARGRKLNRANLVDRAVAYLPGPRVDDGEGGWYEGPPTELRFWCRVQSASSLSQQLEEVAAEQLRAPGLTVIAYDVEVDLPDDAVVDVTSNGVTTRYEVVGHLPLPSYAVMRRSILKRQPAVESGVVSS